MRFEIGVPGFYVWLEDYCAYCPHFEAEVEKTDIGNCEESYRAVNEIYCTNREKCAIIAKNLRVRIDF